MKGILAFTTLLVIFSAMALAAPVVIEDGNILANAGHNGIILRSAAGIDHVLGDNASGEYNGIVMRAKANPTDGEPLFIVQSSGFAERLRVEHNGYLKTINNLAVQGSGNSYILGNLALGKQYANSRLDVNGDITLHTPNDDIVIKSAANVPFYLGDNHSGEPYGIVLRAGANPPPNGALFVVQSAGKAERLRVEHDGYTKTVNDLAVEGWKDSYFLGNVGIGTKYPTSRLEVNGDITLRTKDNDIAIRDQRGAYHFIGDNYSGEQYGIVLRTSANPPDGEPIFVVESAGFAQRLRVEHNGYLKTINDLAVDGTGKSYVMGNLGIGTRNPTARLEVNSVIRSTPTDTPGSCGFGSEGAMYYDKSLREPCFCNGAAWKQFDGGGAC